MIAKDFILSYCKSFLNQDSPLLFSIRVQNTKPYYYVSFNKLFQEFEVVNPKDKNQENHLPLVYHEVLELVPKRFHGENHPRIELIVKP